MSHLKLVYLVMLLVNTNNAVLFSCSNCHHFCNADKLKTPLYNCECFNGYFLSGDQRTCSLSSEPASLVYRMYEDVIMMSVSGNGSTTQVIPISIGTAQDITGLDVDSKNFAIVYSSAPYGQIHYLNIVTNVEYVAHDIGIPFYVNFDWITGNMYYLDRFGISVLNMQKKLATRIINQDPADVLALSVDPVNGFLFYVTSNNYNKLNKGFVLRRADLDGSKLMDIVYSNSSFYSYGLAPDFNNQVLYYSIMETDTIECVDYWGRETKTVVKENDYMTQPTYMDFFQNKILVFSYNDQNTLSTCSRFTGDCHLFLPEIAEDTNYHPSYFKVFQASKQPQSEDPCLEIKCEHICVKTSSGAVCLCDDDFQQNYENQCLSERDVTVKKNRILPNKGVEESCPGNDSTENTEKESVEKESNENKNIKMDNTEKENVEIDNTVRKKVEIDHKKRERVKDEKNQKKNIEKDKTVRKNVEIDNKERENSKPNQKKRIEIDLSEKGNIEEENKKIWQCDCECQIH